MKKLLTLSIAGVVVTGLASGAFAASGASTEVSTAHAHALMAHTHLHHVVNCLVGPSGEGFDAAPGDPCKGQGDGALPDSTHNPALHAKLENALQDAQAGLASSSLATAHKDATKVAATLQATPKQKASGGYSW